MLGPSAGLLLQNSTVVAGILSLHVVPARVFSYNLTNNMVRARCSQCAAVALLLVELPLQV